MPPLTPPPPAAETSSPVSALTWAKCLHGDHVPAAWLLTICKAQDSWLAGCRNQWGYQDRQTHSRAGLCDPGYPLSLTSLHHSARPLPLTLPPPPLNISVDTMGVEVAGGCKPGKGPPPSPALSPGSAPRWSSISCTSEIGFHAPTHIHQGSCPPAAGCCRQSLRVLLWVP